MMVLHSVICYTAIAVCLDPVVKVGGNALERHSRARRFCNLAFPDLRERFFHWNACVPWPER